MTDVRGEVRRCPGCERRFLVAGLTAHALEWHCPRCTEFSAEDYPLGEVQI